MSKGPWLDADPEFNAAAKAKADAMRRAGLRAAEAWYRSGGSPRRRASWAEVERRIREVMRGRPQTIARAKSPILVSVDRNAAPVKVTFADDPNAISDKGSPRPVLWA